MVESFTEKEVKRYYELSVQKKGIEQELNHLKKKFHQLFDDAVGKNHKGEFQLGDYKIQRQIRTSISYHDEQTVQKLEALNLADFIILEKRADADKLEAAMKIGLVEDKDFDDCKRTKLTQAIVVKTGG